MRFCRRSVSDVQFTAFGSLASRSLVIFLSTKKPAAPIFRVEDAIKMETEFSSKRRHPRRPETLMWMLPPWEFQVGSGGGVHGSPLPPFESLAYAYICFLLIVFSYIRVILFFGIKHVRTTVAFPWIRHCQKPTRFMYSVLCSARVCNFTLRYLPFLVRTDLSLRAHGLHSLN